MARASTSGHGGVGYLPSCPLASGCDCDGVDDHSAEILLPRCRLLAVGPPGTGDDDENDGSPVLLESLRILPTRGGLVYPPSA